MAVEKRQGGVSRRTIATGAAWAVPTTVLATAAPALAASGEACLTGAIYEATYNATSGAWVFYWHFTNSCSVAATIHSITVYTSYHSPATGDTAGGPLGTAVAVMALSVLNNVAPNGGTADFGMRPETFSPAPANGSASYLPRYYNDYPGTNVPPGQVPCDRFARNYDWPACCTRLLNDSTYAIVGYSQGSTSGTITVTFDDDVACAVISGCAL